MRGTTHVSLHPLLKQCKHVEAATREAVKVGKKKEKKKEVRSGDMLCCKLMSIGNAQIRAKKPCGLRPV